MRTVCSPAILEKKSRPPPVAVQAQRGGETLLQCKPSGLAKAPRPTQKRKQENKLICHGQHLQAAASPSRGLVVSTLYSPACPHSPNVATDVLQMCGRQSPATCVAVNVARSWPTKDTQ